MRLPAHVLFAGSQGSELADWPISGCSAVALSATKPWSQVGCSWLDVLDDVQFTDEVECLEDESDLLTANSTQ